MTDALPFFEDNAQSPSTDDGTAMTMVSMLRQDLVVADRYDDRGSIVRLDLVRADGSVLPAFSAGAHVEIEIASLEDGRSLRRRYSLWGDPTDRYRWRLGILLSPASRGGSQALHTRAHRGSRIAVGPPANDFPLAPEGAAVLVGGGIGITPLLAMAHTLTAEGRPFVLHYVTRSAGRTAFLDLLPTFPFADRIRLHHDDGIGALPFDPTRDLTAPDDDAHLYVCGPAGFMDHCTAAARGLGWAAPRIHQEAFGADVDTTGSTFEVVARRSAVTVRVGPQETIANALSGAGVPVELSCGEGVCGACACDVVEGKPDHRDHVLTDEEKARGDQILICCSRALGARLVLDL
ncbi:MAG: putative oxygenase electron transfer component [Proteobacteria bacterium]|nr:putative oxygenase electron transfer component [Pseudomonadota bacterium]